MIEALEFWNEPNNLSHWDFELDPEWREFARMIRLASARARELAPGVRRVLGGICPIDPEFVRRMGEQGALDHLDRIAVHGFPIDWDCWRLDEWPDRIAQIEAVSSLPVWVTEVGTSSLGAEEVQAFGLERTTRLLKDRVERVYWYSLFDLPRDWPATISRREAAHGSNYARHFHMGLVREDGKPKLAARRFDPALGLCQWFHWQDPRLESAVRWLRRLGVRRLRTGISWADWHRDGHLAWFDRQMDLLADFDVTVILCFTPPSRGRRACHTSPPVDAGEFAWYTEEVLRRYFLFEGWRPSAEAVAGTERRPLVGPAERAVPAEPAVRAARGAGRVRSGAATTR
jgi:beta-xylosidase